MCLAINTEWIYSSSNTIDPWIYHAYFHRLPAYVSKLYPETYYGTRLAWIVPGYLAYTLFTPHVANLILHLGLYYVAVAAIYRTVAVVADRDSALIAALLFGTAPQVLIAIGYDYVDGAVLMYFAVSVACFTVAARSAFPGWYVFAAGVAFAGIVHSNLAALILAPAGPLSYWVLRRHQSIRQVAVSAAVWLGGAVMLTLILGIVNVWVGGSLLFFMPSVNWARTSVGTQTFVPRSLLDPQVLAHLTLPAIAAVMAVGLIIARRSAETLAACAPLLAGWLGLALYDVFTHGAMLQTQYYVSWLLVPSFVVIGVATYPLRGTRAVLRGLALAVSISVVSWSVSSRLAIGLDPYSREQFDLVEQTLQFVSRYVPVTQGRPLFWLEQGDKYPFARSLASTHLYLYSLVGSDYPRLPPDVTKQPRFGATITAGSSVVIVSFRAPDPGQVAGEFARFGFTTRIIASEAIGTGRTRCVLTVLEVGQLPRLQAAS